MNFATEHLNEFIDREIKVLNQLKTIISYDFKSIHIDCGSLEDYINNEKPANYHNIKYYMQLKDVKGPVLYFFKIESTHQGDEIVKTLKKIKKRVGEGRHCPKIKQKEAYNSKVLYVGSVRKGIATRILQHLGYGSQRTYALQLVHWAKGLKLKLSFNYLEINSEYLNSLEYLEEAVWRHYDPLVGKKPK